MHRYRARISGPLLDRIDLHVEVPRVPASALRGDVAPGESSAAVRARVAAARARQQARGAGINARLDSSGLAAHCRLRASEESLLERAADQLRLSARAVQRILRVARTIADLDGAAAIAAPHLAEAIGYRRRGSERMAA